MPQQTKPQKVLGPKASRRTPEKRREELREALWPNSRDLIWSRKANKGFGTIPRVLPLVMLLIKLLCDRGNPCLVYLELWARAFDEGIVTIRDEPACAYASGYTGTRATRTWREHMLKLEELGFIKTKPEGIRGIGHVLLLNPLAVCAQLYREKKQQIPEEWWSAFVTRAGEIGAEIPTAHQEESE